MKKIHILLTLSAVLCLVLGIVGYIATVFHKREDNYSEKIMSKIEEQYQATKDNSYELLAFDDKDSSVSDKSISSSSIKKPSISREEYKNESSKFAKPSIPKQSKVLDKLLYKKTLNKKEETRCIEEKENPYSILRHSDEILDALNRNRKISVISTIRTPSSKYFNYCILIDIESISDSKEVDCFVYKSFRKQFMFPGKNKLFWIMTPVNDRVLVSFPSSDSKLPWAESSNNIKCFMSENFKSSVETALCDAFHLLNMCFYSIITNALKHSADGKKNKIVTEYILRMMQALKNCGVRENLSGWNIASSEVCSSFNILTFIRERSIDSMNSPESQLAKDFILYNSMYIDFNGFEVKGVDNIINTCYKISLNQEDRKLDEIATRIRDISLQDLANIEFSTIEDILKIYVFLLNLKQESNSFDSFSEVWDSPIVLVQNKKNPHNSKHRIGTVKFRGAEKSIEITAEAIEKIQNETDENFIKNQ